MCEDGWAHCLHPPPPIQEGMAPREVYSIKKPWFREARSSRWRQKPRHFLGSGVKCVRLKTSASCVVFNRRDAPTPCNAASGAAAGENGAQELNVGLGGVWGSGRAGLGRPSRGVLPPQPRVFRVQAPLSLLSLLKIEF